MYSFYIIIELLILKILLVGLMDLITASHYEYGYHPSAEEFDHLLHETQSTWTHGFLKAERDHQTAVRYEAVENRVKFKTKYFVPKFQYKNKNPKTNNQPVENSFTKQQIPQLASFQKHLKLLENVNSSLERFNVNISHKLPTPFSTAPFKIQRKVLRKPSNAAATTTTIQPLKVIKPVGSALPLVKPSVKKIYRKTTQADFPIYFTNPATGIVYAIAEMGKSKQNITTTNGTIPILITKEQYERDILQLAKEYKEKCRKYHSAATRRRPHVITASNLASLGNSTKEPLPPVVIKTELIVQDKKPLTVIRRPAQKHKSKNKKTLRSQPEALVVVKGSRSKMVAAYENQAKLPTQLEKPNLDNIFSSSVPPENLVTLKPNLFHAPKHKVNKRSLEQEPESVSENGPIKSRDTVSEKSVFNVLKNATTNLLLSEINSLKPNSKKLVRISSGRAKSLNKNAKENLLAKLTNNFLEKLCHSRNVIKRKKRTAISKNRNKLVKNQNIERKLRRFKSHLSKTPPTTAGLISAALVNANNSINQKIFKKAENNNSNNGSLTNNRNLSNSLKTKNNSNNNLPGNPKIFNYKTSLDLEKPKNFRENKFQVTFVNLKNFTVDLKHRMHKRSIENLLENNSNAQNNNSTQKSNATTISISISNATSKQVEHHSGPENVFTSNQQKLEQQNITKSNATETGKKSKLARYRKRIVKHFKKRKRLANAKLHKKLRRRPNVNSSKLITTPRSIRSRRRKRPYKNKKVKKKPEQIPDEEEYYFFDMGDDYEEPDEEDEDYEDENENEDEDDDQEDNEDEDDIGEELEELEEADEEDEEDEDDEEGEEINYKHKKHEEHMYEDHNNEEDDYNDDEPFDSHTTVSNLSEKDTKPATVNSPPKKTEDKAPDIERIDLKSPATHSKKDNRLDLKRKHIYIKKRTRRRPPHMKMDEDYEDGDDYNGMNSNNVGEFFRMIFYPLQVAVTSVVDSFSNKAADEEDDAANYEPPKHYNSHHNRLKHHASDEYDDDYDSPESSDSSFGSWFSSWFAFNRRNKKISSTTPAPVRVKPAKTSNGWLPSWMSFGAGDRVSPETATNEDYDEYDKWFSSWFGNTKPKPRRRRTTTTSTTTQIPLVPILTIVDPMRNPQNWIGILAHHIINHTSTSTMNPLKDIWNKHSSADEENSETPRKVSYDKYQIWRLKPQDDSQVKALEEYKKSEDGIKLQWLRGPSLRGITDVLVPPKMLVDFQASLTFELIDHEVLIFDVGKAIAYEKTKEDYFFATTQKPKRHQGKNNTAAVTGMTWHKYYKYDDIVNYLEIMRMRFPHLVELIHIGRSYEGRPLIVMKIESKEAAEVNFAHYPAHQRNKLRHKKRIGLANAVFIEAGTHGMEWIGPATATWIINELLRVMKKNGTDDQSFIRNTTWYIMPVLNPDGYVYSHEYDRFWKKSRSRQVSRPTGLLSSAMTWLQKKRAKEKICFGVNLDRNWHYHWGRRGSSRSACNEFYAGPTPFSEPETKALSEFLMDYRTQIKLFVSMQAYGQIISYPYKANTTYDYERLDDLLDVALVGADGLRRRSSKSRYKIDSSHDLIESRSGCSDAFAAYEVGIPFSYTLHLADNGVHGYLLPSDSIESTAKDSFEIITGMLDYI